jgi:hypothetical protein
MKPIKGLAPDSPSLENLGGAVWPMDCKEVPLAFNPSLCRDKNGQIVAVVRRTNYQLDTKFGALSIPSGARSVKNASYFSVLDENLTPTGWTKIEFIGDPQLKRGAEDARIIKRDDKLYLNVVLLEKDIPRARVAIYRLEDDLTASHIKTYPGKSTSVPEKNWMTYLEASSNKFDFVSDLENNIRGGSSLITWGSGYLAICHKTYLDKNKYYNPMTFGIQEGIERTYTHLFVEFDSNLNQIRTSKEFFLVDRGIEFATGLIELDDDLVIGFGRKDKEAWFGKISKSKVDKMLKEGA